MAKITYADYEISLETFGRSVDTNEKRFYEFIRAVNKLARQKRFAKIEVTVSDVISGHSVDADEWS